MKKGKLTIAYKQCKAYTTHCQLHGEPTEREASTHIKFNIDGGKVTHRYIFANATETEILSYISSIGINYTEYDYQFMTWDNFSLFIKAPVMLSLPSDDEIITFINTHKIEGDMFNVLRTAREVELMMDLANWMKKRIERGNGA
jgi:hypothetical protein